MLRVLLLLCAVSVAMSSTWETYNHVDMSSAGTDYKSASLTQNACHNACVDDDVCVAYVWAPRAPNAGISNACALGRNCCYMKNKVTDVFATSGYTESFVVAIKPEGGWATYWGVDMSAQGTDIPSVGLGLSACEDRCATDSTCVAYVWAPSAPNAGCGAVGVNCCYMKNKVTALISTSGYTDTFITAIKPTDSTWEIYNNVDMSSSGTDYKSMHLGENACQNQCGSEPNCAAYVWVPRAPNAGISNACALGQNCCYLKNQVTSTIYTPGYTSGFVVGVKNSKVPNWYIYKKVDMSAPNGDYKSVALNQASCHNTCESDPVCVAYTWAPQAPNAGCGAVGINCCYMKKLNTPLIYTPKYTDKFVTGVKKPESYNWNSYQNADMSASGTDYRQLAVDESKCKASCTEDNRCKAYVWAPRSPNTCPAGGPCCYLKSSVTPVIYNSYTIGIASKLNIKKDAHVDWALFSGSDMSAQGTDYKHIATSSVADCQNACGSDSICLAYVYVPSDKICYMKNAVTALITNSNSRTFTTGIKGKKE